MDFYGLAAEARKKRRLIRHSEEIEYESFREKFGEVPRGTVLADGRIILGFERIMRIFTLGKGLERNVSAEYVYAEEKIDGFNVRVAMVKGRIYAFSRGGFLDAFATEKARGMGFESFFRDFPERVVCGEMVGNTPYTRPTRKYDVKLYVFDIMEPDGRQLPPPERYALVKKYRMEGVPSFGRFRRTDTAKLKKIALALNKAHREGMVLKSEDRKEVVKYVTPNADIDDIGNAGHALFDMPAGFFNQRMLRSAIFIRELKLDGKKYGKELGTAIYSKLMETLAEAESGGSAHDEFEILIKDPAIWDTINRHMSKEIRMETVFKRKERGGTRIRFRKTYKDSTKRIRDALAGKGIID